VDWEESKMIYEISGKMPESERLELERKREKGTITKDEYIRLHTIGYTFKKSFAELLWAKYNNETGTENMIFR
jgi:hypothetical protein